MRFRTEGGGGAVGEVRDQLSADVVSVDGIALASNATVKNLYVIFDRDLSCNSHVKQISRTALFYLRNI